MALLLTLITCNIYGFYWAYKMGGLLDKAQTDRGMPAQNLAVVYLILELIIAPVAWSLIQICRDDGDFIVNGRFLWYD